MDGTDVERLPWPDARARRRELAAAGRPRLLLVAADAAPPVAADDLEDWVRLPAPTDDVEARVLGLLRRLEARRRVRPRVDLDGVLRHGERSTVLSEAEARLARVLVDRLGAVVSRPALERAGWPGGHVARNTLDVHVHRLRRRLPAVELHLRTVRSRGYVLEAA